jgi:hypothetical protein
MSTYTVIQWKQTDRRTNSILLVVQFILRSVCYHCMYSFLPWLTKNTLNITFSRVVLSANLDRPRDLTLCSFLCTSLFYVQLRIHEITVLTRTSGS